MKILQVFLFTVVALCTSVCYGSNWVPYVPYIKPIPATQPIVEVPAVPSVTYSTYTRPLMMMYDWVPYTVNHLVVTERQGLFCRHRTYHYEPRIEWIYQPVYK